jgi:Na+-transporting NADH:ubiquinone oxidoreductase subunit NqrB
MRPMTFINGVLLGSTGALAGVLGVILFFRWVMVGDPTLDQTVVRSDLPLGDILRYMAAFGALAVLALTAFFAELRQKRWRLLADWLMSVALVGVIILFLGDPALHMRDFMLLAAAGIAGVLLFVVARRLGFLARMSRWLGD